MNKKGFTALKFAHFVEKMEKWRRCTSPKPAKGWVTYSRESLNMSQDQLARKVGLSQPGLRKLEQSERKGTITLFSLQKIADALNCELRYGFVPKQGMREYVEQTALKKAAEEMQKLTHTMELEAQKTSSKHNKARVKALAKELVEGMDKRLWD